GAKEVVAATKLGDQQARNALLMAAQLRLLEPDAASPGQYRYVGSQELRRAPSDALPVFFRAAAQRFPPFLLYVSFLSRRFPRDESARLTAASFDIGLNAERMSRVFNAWGTYSGIIEKAGQLTFTPQELLDLGFLARLANALADELA